MSAEVSYFGIRHHGPGSARRLIEALDDLSPEVVLIEGPADLSDLLPMLASPGMVPPVALLAYPADDPAQAVFWPFAAFSPEYQAVVWAVSRGVTVRFIDLPVVWRLPGTATVDPDADADQTGELEAADPHAEQRGINPVERDPIGALANAAGYEDGESWWRDVIEENPEPGPVFAAVADAMTELREAVPPPDDFEAAREAHMRLEIAKARKDATGPVAVVCGAWHVPGLKEKHTAKDDRARIKGGPKRKISATWAPWTSPRLAFASGYGAGVSAPGWCAHLWHTPRAELTTRWIARIARALRGQGHVVSTASLIETEWLAVSLAALRGRPLPGFEEIREAAIACLCFGAPLLWQTISDELLIGGEVGAIPDDVPLAPLLEDLQRQQKKARLKPEALERELSLDLRSESGLFRSTLLHRLSALDVPWGTLADVGRSRGTFRERWALRWDPEYAVALVENLVHGATIEQAAGGRLRAHMDDAQELGALADLVFAAMTAQLGDAAARGIDLLGKRAAQTSDCAEMLGALAPIADVLRYGKARATDTDQLASLFHQIATQGALALAHAVRNLDADAAETMRATVRAADAAIRLVASEAENDAAKNEDGADETVLTTWQSALEDVVGDVYAARLIAGMAARLLYDADQLDPNAAAELLSRMLSPGTPVGDAADFFAGFFEGSGQQLLYDPALRGCVDDWLCGLEEDAFTEYLPLFRRVFSGLDAMERKRLLDALFSKSRGALTGLTLVPDAEALWAAHFARLLPILKGEGVDG